MLSVYNAAHGIFGELILDAEPVMRPGQYAP